MDATTSEVTATVTRTARRGRCDYDAETMTLGEQVYYSGGAWPDPVRKYLLLTGLKTALLAEKDAGTAYANLVRGKLPEQKPRAPPRRAKSREAVAYALAYASAQDALPRGTKRAALEAAAASRVASMREHVAGLSRDAVRRLCQRADVQEHYRRLFGSKTEDHQLSLLAIAGVADKPLAAEVQDEVTLPWEAAL